MVKDDIIKNTKEKKNRRNFFHSKRSWDANNNELIIGLKIGEMERNFLKGYLKTNEIKTSENWFDENRERQQFYFGCFNLAELLEKLKIRDSSVVDNYGVRLTKNIGILRTKSLLDDGEATIKIPISKNSNEQVIDVKSVDELISKDGIIAKLLLAINKEVLLAGKETTMCMVESKKTQVKCIEKMR